MKLLINAGGKGLRLKHLTHDIPKPMLEVAGKPVLEHLVDWAGDNGIEEVVMLTGFMSGYIEDYFGDGSRLGVKISYSSETEPLGSGGGVKKAMHLARDTFALVSGDCICKVDLRKMVQSHKNASDAIMTLFLHKTSHPEDSDILQVDEDMRVKRFISKKDDHTGAGDLGNAGLFIIEPEILDFMCEDKFTFETYLIPRLLEAGKYLNAYCTDEYMADMGTPERLAKVEEYLKNE